MINSNEVQDSSVRKSKEGYFQLGAQGTSPFPYLGSCSERKPAAAFGKTFPSLCSLIGRPG